MKVRTGFVSNSSSSSFVILGKKITMEEIYDYENVYFCGGYLSEGEDLFLLDDEFKQTISTYNFSSNEFIVAVKTGDGDDGLAITAKDIEDSPFDEVKIYSYEKDYHTSDGRGVEDFIERYSRRGW